MRPGRMRTGNRHRPYLAVGAIINRPPAHIFLHPKRAVDNRPYERNQTVNVLTRLRRIRDPVPRRAGQAVPLERWWAIQL